MGFTNYATQKNDTPAPIVGELTAEQQSEAEGWKPIHIHALPHLLDPVLEALNIPLADETDKNKHQVILNNILKTAYSYVSCVEQVRNALSDLAGIDKPNKPDLEATLAAINELVWPEAEEDLTDVSSVDPAQFSRLVDSVTAMSQIGTVEARQKRFAEIKAIEKATSIL